MEFSSAPRLRTVGSFRVTTLAPALALCASCSSARAQNVLTAEQMQIEDTVKTIFAAALADDVAMLNTAIAPDF